jgi:uncharacterized membrane protein YbhN (UPF0104 family)
MVSLIWSALVILFSAALFVYWFRYSCILILRTRTSSEYGSALAGRSDLTFEDIQKELESSRSSEQIELLRAALDRDYAIVAALLANTPGISEHFSALEHLMLRADYRVMQAWDTLSRSVIGQPSRGAVTEMSAIVAFFANVAGEAGVLSSEA